MIFFFFLKKILKAAKTLTKKPRKDIRYGTLRTFVDCFVVFFSHIFSELNKKIEFLGGERFQTAAPEPTRFKKGLLAVVLW
jgi:hypothetical protein